ncbi:hypothetical protein Pla52o_34940 [Novipirellula galeiformis]|uniref:Uncharacterized protein n=1 Tax=Novipirellula galeiformis TaxID=2528004 RepID=A0A5C6CDU9_9BACT|nr:hypothetical protein [Novipirellula galeiformis]TWU22438.1 hypothetical protein Pla52o_34940 [Novipirellula galeiformis]
MSVNDDMKDPNKVVLYLVIGALLAGLLAFSVSGKERSRSGGYDGDSGQQVYTPRGDW